ncbi:MAG: hypothetical protein RSA49_05250, partial [Anaerovoracaceae bacterium]
MQYSSFFKSINGDRKYKVDIFAAYFASFVGNGVFGKSLENLAVLAKEGMNIIVKPGKAWINGYFYINDSDLNFKLDNADGVLKRIDRLVIRWSLLDRKISIEIKKGVMSQEPTPAVLKRDGEVYELAIADILIGNGVIAITKAMITDLRLDSNLCGIVTGVIDQVDTTTLFNQIQGEVEDMKLWVESEKDEINRILEAAIGETLAGELINMINANTSSITALDKKVNANEEAITKKGNCNARFLQGET